MINEDLFLLIVPYAKYSKLDLNVICEELNKAAETTLTNKKRLAAFIAQCASESGSFNILVENLKYSSDGLIRTFPNIFKDKIISDHYAWDPVRIANKVYANKGGNGNEMSGDGWKYRGRGFIQLTLKNNYEQCGKDIGLDLINHPELLEQITNAISSALWYWKIHNLNDLADKEDIDGITKKINAAMLSAAQRKAYYERGLQVIP
jgi:putative chitinase